MTFQRDIAELPGDDQALAEGLRGVLVPVQIEVHGAEGVQRITLACLVAELSTDGEIPLQGFQCQLGGAVSDEEPGDVVQHRALAVFVAVLTKHRHG